jgi:hypothetical protein
VQASSLLIDGLIGACSEFFQERSSCRLVTCPAQPIIVSEWLADGFSNFHGKQQRQWLRSYLTRLAEFASHPLCAGHCYIQLYDIERERNGYLYYDRQSKMDQETEATLRAAHLQAVKRDLKFDWEGFINAHCPR